MISLLKGFAKLDFSPVIAVVAAASSIALGTMLVGARMEVADIRKDRDALYAQIHNPDTGYVARLKQCRTNTDELQMRIDGQNVAIEKLGETTAARLAEATEQVLRANDAAYTIQAKYHAAMSAPIRGETVCERVDDVDNRFMSTLR